MDFKIKTLATALFTFISLGVFSQIDLDYQEPPQAILDLADVAPPPSVILDNDANWMVMLYRSAFKSIEEVSAEEYRLAGLRINPKNNGSSRTTFYRNISVLNIKTGEEKMISGLPSKPYISNFNWAPDFKQFAFTNTSENGFELWIANVEDARARRITEPVLNDVFSGDPYLWSPDSKYLLCKFVSGSRGKIMADDVVPAGPIIQENLGKTAPARTYQDLLKSPRDEHNFDYFAASELKMVSLDGTVTPFMDDAIYLDMSFSPDGEFMMISTLHKPYSYLVPYYRFPTKTIITDRSGKLVKELFDAPLEEARPKGFMATSQGPRNYNWRPDKPATIYWVEALDGGDPEIEVEYRDALFTLNAPFTATPSELVKVPQRYSFVQWSDDDLALIYDYWWNTRSRKAYKFSPGNISAGAEIVFDINTEDLYNNPGYFATELNKYGKSVLLKSKNQRTLYLTGQGYSPEGNKPFVDAFDIKTNGSQRIWQADGISTYEQVVEIVNIQKGDILTRIESPTENPNYYLRNIFRKENPRQITHIPNPYKALEGVSKEMIHYKRDDGTDLTAILYLPSGYDAERDGRLPVFLWAYPREYKDADAAGQVKDSPLRFISINYGSPLFWVVRGYAVLDRTDFPIIGEGETEPNDTFVEQLVANADAAITKLVDMGIGDPARIGVGGHSYGAFMTANLLAHSDLFAAGIARSGAYNRSLTPFGFQSEERTFWEAPEIYFQMSPFMHADEINEPLLMIHGTADNNSGTFPMQSERMYNAIKGHGGTVRLVMLPNESHGYAARESIMHMLWEMDNWLETYVKNRKPIDDTKLDPMNK